MPCLLSVALTFWTLYKYTVLFLSIYAFVCETPEYAHAARSTDRPPLGQLLGTKHIQRKIWSADRQSQGTVPLTMSSAEAIMPSRRVDVTRAGHDASAAFGVPPLSPSVARTSIRQQWRQRR